MSEILQDEAAKQAAQISETRANAEASQKERAAYLEAMEVLYSTDHELLKLLEANLAAAGALPLELMERRQRARETVRTERTRLRERGLL